MPTGIRIKHGIVLDAGIVREKRYRYDGRVGPKSKYFDPEAFGHKVRREDEHAERYVFLVPHPVFPNAFKLETEANSEIPRSVIKDLVEHHLGMKRRAYKDTVYYEHPDPEIPPGSAQHAQQGQTRRAAEIADTFRQRYAVGNRKKPASR